jgi:hypothetical protein
VASLAAVTDVDRRVALREIADTLVRALERRDEVVDVIVEAEDYDAVGESIATTLGTSLVAAESGAVAVLRPAHRGVAAQDPEELEDLNTQLSFTM